MIKILKPAGNQFIRKTEIFKNIPLSFPNIQHLRQENTDNEREKQVVVLVDVTCPNKIIKCTSILSIDTSHIQTIGWLLNMQKI